MFGEVTGEGRNNTEKKNIIDLIRLGMFMKDSIDLTLHKANVNCVLFGWQCIGKQENYFIRIAVILLSRRKSMSRSKQTIICVTLYKIASQ